MRFQVPALVLLPLMAAGCVHYEYDIVSPPELRQHIGARQSALVSRPPLQYRMITYDNELVIRVFNPTADRIMLLGWESSVVGPWGQSHPLRTRTIAPHSYIKLVLPPMPPEPVWGPTWGFGLGFGYATPYWGVGYYEPAYGPLYYPPRYYTAYDWDSGEYWSWPGGADVRLALVFQQGQQKPFSQEFTLHRQKM